MLHIITMKHCLITKLKYLKTSPPSTSTFPAPEALNFKVLTSTAAFLESFLVATDFIDTTTNMKISIVRNTKLLMQLKIERKSMSCGLGELFSFNERHSALQGNSKFIT